LTVVVIRCTRKLLSRLGHTSVDESAASSTLLGDWYANLVSVSRARFVLCVSERTLLPVVLEARQLGTLGARLAAGAAEVMAAIGVPADLATAEQNRMAEVAFARTVSRRVLGSMTDLVYTLAAFNPNAPLLEMSLKLADTPCGPLRMATPMDETRSAFSET
jgi:hypothetical protein